MGKRTGVLVGSIAGLLIIAGIIAAVVLVTNAQKERYAVAWKTCVDTGADIAGLDPTDATDDASTDEFIDALIVVADACQAASDANEGAFVDRWAR